MNAIMAVIFPVIFLGISTLIFSGSIDDSELPQHNANIACPFPLYDAIDYLNGTIDYDPPTGDGTFYLCTPSGQSTIINEYDATLFDTIPYGWLGYISDWLTALVTKLSAMTGIIGIFSSATIPVNLITEAPILAVPYAVIFLILGMGIYLLVHPLKR